MDFNFLVDGVRFLFEGEGWKNAVMWAIGFLLIFLAIRKGIEPALLLPMGFGAILINIPLVEPHVINALYTIGIESDAMPLILFIGIGAMIDFGPLLSNPKLLLFGAAAQVGIYIAFIIAVLFFSPQDAGAIAIIGAADGPTTIVVANAFKSSLIGPITVVAYSYMALVPLIQPITIKALTTKKERRIRMEYKPSSVSKRTRILFPILVTLVAGLAAPGAMELVAFLMFGNLLKECLVLNSLAETAKTALVNIITLFLGLVIASTMQANVFLTTNTAIIMGLGLFAFIFDTAGGVLFAKFMNLFLKKKINPMIGGSGISAFPMSARVIQKLGLEADPENHLLMHAIGTNVSGQIASVVAGGLMLTLAPLMFGF